MKRENSSSKNRSLVGEATRQLFHDRRLFKDCRLPSPPQQRVDNVETVGESGGGN
jgi:hypothetical protein